MSTVYTYAPPVTTPSQRKKAGVEPKPQARRSEGSFHKARLRERIESWQQQQGEWWHRSARRALEEVGFFRQSLNLEFCVSRGGLYRCNQHLLCGHCRFAEAAKQGKDYAARVVLARESNPRLTLLAAVFGVGERDRYAIQAKELLKVLKRVRRRKRGAWSKVRGMIWHIEPALSPSGLWFAHLHCVIAIDADDQPDHQIQLATAFAGAARRVCYPNEPLARGSSDARLETLLRLQRVQPVWAFEGDRFAWKLSAHSSIGEIAHHVARLVLYARKSGGVPERGDLRDLRPAHFVEVMQHKGHKSGTTGDFRGLPAKALLATRQRLFPNNRIPTRPREAASTNAPKATSPRSRSRRSQQRAKPDATSRASSTKRPAGRGVVPKGPRRRSKREASSTSADLVSKQS